jgi:hypothetical protein
MSKIILWETMKDTVGICNETLEEVISKLGGDGITLPQARRACKDGIFSFPDAVKSATALQLSNWKLALGKVVAHVHPKAKKYYEDKVIYIQNQKALEEGRLEAIDQDAARAAARMAAWAAADAETAWDAADWAAETTGDVDDLIDIYFDVLEEA